MTRGIPGAGRHLGEYDEDARRADDAMRALFLTRPPLERERTPTWCIPNGGGVHRSHRSDTRNPTHGLAAARDLRGLER